MSEKQKMELVASRVEELISEFHEISSTYVEHDPEHQAQRMAEIYAAVSFLAGEMRGYLHFMGMGEESLQEVGRKVNAALGAVALTSQRN